MPRQQRGDNSRGRLVPAWPRIPGAGIWSPFTATGPGLRGNFGVDPTTGAVGGVPGPNPDLTEYDWVITVAVGTTVRIDWTGAPDNFVYSATGGWRKNGSFADFVSSAQDSNGVLLTFSVAVIAGDTITYTGPSLQSGSSGFVPKNQMRTV